MVKGKLYYDTYKFPVKKVQNLIDNQVVPLK
jgi:hypothetical protein